MNASVNALRRLCAVLVGFVFCFSGLLKLADSVGTSLIVTEYFKFFHFGWLKFASVPFGIVLSILETVTGAALICGVWRKITAWVCGIMMAGFTIITLILWIFNPSMDCGCFGQAIHLTHAQSLLKNIVLDALWVGAFIPFRDFGEPRKVKKVSFMITTLSVIVAAIWCSVSLPPVDFTEFAPGAELLSAQQTLEYNGGGDETFTPGGPLLCISDDAGNYHDELAADGDVMVLSIYHPSRVGTHGWRKIAEMTEAAQEAGYSTLLLVTGTDADVPVTVPEFYFSDYKTLITLNRSNGGVTYISDGQIVRKWTMGSFPVDGSLAPAGEALPTDIVSEYSHRGKMRAQGFLLYIFAIMLLL